MSRIDFPQLTRRLATVTLLAVPLLASSGCSNEAKFNYNAVYALSQTNEFGGEFSPERQQEIGNILKLIGIETRGQVGGTGEENTL